MELKEEMVSQQTVYEGIIVNVRRDKAGWRWSASSVTPWAR